MQAQPISLDQMSGICAEFQVPGRVVAAEPSGSGHIHDTYTATCDDAGARRRYIVQKVNCRIFRNVELLMENVWRVTGHIRAKVGRLSGGRPDRETLSFVPTRDGRHFLRTGDGGVWRVYARVEETRTIDVLENGAQAYEAARAFGRFQKYLADLPPPPLHETIPDFHNTPKRFAALESAIEADAAGRADSCGPEIEFALGLKPVTDVVTSALASGEMPLRVTHNDTKINNVLFDESTGAGVCVIDLDTVMPGSVLYDFGDQIRSTVGFFEENERDLGKCVADLDCFENLVKGYLEEAGAFLTPKETDLLHFSGILITFEIGIRFLADYLNGDVYFKVHRPGENLDRARTQFSLVRSLQANEKAMTAIVRKHRRDWSA